MSIREFESAEAYAIRAERERASCELAVLSMNARQTHITAFR